MIRHFTNNLLIAVFLLATAWPAFAKQHQMATPEYEAFAPAIARPLTQQEVRAAVIDAAQARGWVVTGDEPGKLTLRYAPRTHLAVIAVNYDDKGFKIGYVTSEDLDYEVKRGKTYIHGNYNLWLERLSHDIKNSKVLWSVVDIAK
jgi:hypothetical protein